MIGPIDPIKPVRLVKREAPRQEPPAGGEGPVINVTVNIGAPAPEPSPSPTRPPTNLDAHMIAQGARVRGLRGGPRVLAAARAAYLETEWSGSSDRRTRRGRITKADV